MRRGRTPSLVTLLPAVAQLRVLVLLTALALLVAPARLLAQDAPAAEPGAPQQQPAAFLPIVAGQNQPAFALIFDADTPVPPALQPAIEAAVRAAPALRHEPYNVSSFVENNGWYTVYAVPQAVVLGGWQADFAGAAAIELLGRTAADGSATFAVKGSEGYEQLASTVPLHIGVFGAQAQLAAQHTPANAAAVTNFSLPWPASWPWEKWQGWHVGWEPYSIDFAPADRPAVDVYDAVKLSVVAAAAGSVTRTCWDPYQTTLRIDTTDGASTIRHHYVHLSSPSVPTQVLNQAVARGAYLGQVYNGNRHDMQYVQGSQYGTKCGYGDVAHLHFALSTPEITLQGAPADAVAGAPFRSSWVSTTSLACPTDRYAARYYANADAMGTPLFQRCEEGPISWKWGAGSPGYGLPNDNFGVRWTGYAYFAPGVYVFKSASDDGMFATLDDATPIVRAYWNHGATEFNLARSVPAGTHRIDIIYYENSDDASADFRWAPLPTGVLLFGNFEGGRFNGWDESSSQGWPIVDAWSSWNPPAYLGYFNAWLGGLDNEVSTLSQTITLPGDVNTTLSYYYDIYSSDAYGFDWAFVEIDGKVVKTYPLWRVSAGPEYLMATVDLSPYRGRTVTINFRVTTDSSYVSSFMVDHVQLGFYTASAAGSGLESDAELNFEPAADDSAARTKPAPSAETAGMRKPAEAQSAVREPAAESAAEAEAAGLLPWQVALLEASAGAAGLQASDAGPQVSSE